MEELLNHVPTLISDEENKMLVAVPDAEEVKTAVFEMDPASAPGPDGFPGVNNNFITLIPKVENARQVGHYLPICLGNFFFKIIPKIMATRLSLLLPKLISEEHGAFQQGKVITSSIGVASELTNMMASKCCGGTLGMKLDVQKVYDTLEWKFLFDVLGKIGFSHSWIGWIKEMMRSKKMSVLTNGGPVGYFGVERGLKHGDPLTPFLFILAEEVLCHGLTDLRMRGVKMFLDCYQAYSGLKINLEKSKGFCWGYVRSEKRQGGKVDFYLWWEGWNLVRSVMCGIPVHNFSVYVWPASTVELMERWIRNFIWSGDANKSKSITVRWNKLCKPKCEGGLGVRRLKEINLALLAKLAWFIKCDNSRFVEFLRGRLLKVDGSLKKGVKSSILPDIKKVWEMVGDNERWIIGNGKNISFWFDRWVNGQRIYDTIAPYVTNLRLLQDKVADYIGDGEWCLPVPRAPELQERCNQILQIKLLTTVYDDKRVWALTDSGVFSVKSAWERMRVHEPQCRWSRLVWQGGLAPRASVFGWRLMHQSLPTDENATKHAVYGASRCDMCYRSMESSHHIFIECEFANRVCGAVLSMFDLRWIEELF
ncbi:uncharacterized protein LOC122655395 [Telopea speciosissima]|uniref:uncharacterized protein LOC122655395 n=1 Tax=Telopea speciosissima TaxID=54955 RepID=UPI001CC7E0A8|nr:uncharacterized protein LOC122655395 [Telopea speciosissima]